jgi:hypothetical protein
MQAGSMPAMIPSMRLVMLLLCLVPIPTMAQSTVYAVHDTPEPMKTLRLSLSKLGIRVVLEDQKLFSQHMSSMRPQAILMYIHDEFDPAVERFLISYTEQGGRLIVLHHGMASGKMRSARWPGFLGVQILPRDHPDLRGRYFGATFSW